MQASDSWSTRIPSTPSTKTPFQFRNPSFATPQRPLDLDLSSGPDNQSSPVNGDTEETPEPSPRDTVLKSSAAMVQFRSDQQQPAPVIFGRYGISGRGEIQRKPHHDIMARRIYKRKRREADRDIRITRRRPTEDSDSEGEDRATSSSNENTQHQSQEGHEIGFIPTFFSYLETHPNLPHILSYYAQFLLNFFLVSVIIYMIYAFWSTIRSDVNEKSKEAASEILVEMAMCARDFRENKCNKPEARVPAMESICNSWEKCMQRDPTMVGRAKVSAHTFAEIINNFFQPISVKAMVRKSLDPPSLRQLLMVFDRFAYVYSSWAAWPSTTSPCISFDRKLIHKIYPPSLLLTLNIQRQLNPKHLMRETVVISTLPISIQ
ncbi:MAG: hypothetical protein L6R41_003799 [Letrouitia leprolyta]|nr:MAG: hypothetical protein L6R41_003799 [Letrouitia leprolyta]